jgi:hypothetical protein
MGTTDMCVFALLLDDSMLHVVMSRSAIRNKKVLWTIIAVYHSHDMDSQK